MHRYFLLGVLGAMAYVIMFVSESLRGFLSV
jgi:hypothetical protein